MYTSNHLDKVGRIHKQWFNIGVGIKNVANHLHVHD